MDQSEYRGIQLAPDYLDRIKSSKARPLQAKGTIVSEQRLLSILGLTDDELQKKISLHYKKSGDARSFEEEKPRIIRTIIGVLHQAEGGILKDTKDKYLVPEHFLNTPDLFIRRYFENYRQFYNGEEPII